ncbi:MAG: HD domain-containing protein [Anaerovoracaceae bacterium]
MEYKLTYEDIGKKQVILLVIKALRLFDERLVEHGERVAFITRKISEQMYDDTEIDKDKLLILSVFHDIGAYKTELIDEMIRFENTDVFDHSLYGYLFLKYFTPLGKMSHVILFHHTDNCQYEKMDFMYKDYSNLIHLADTVDIAMLGGTKKEDLVKKLRNKAFDTEQVNIFEKLLTETTMFDDLNTDIYRQNVEIWGLGIDITIEEAIRYLKMLVYIIDFKSEVTVTHSIITTMTSIFLAQKLSVPEERIGRVYLGAMLHDIGKIAIPKEILESPNKLTPEQMEIMKKHVAYTEDVIRDLVPDDICEIAVSHHEKLDGSGYHRGLTGEQLSLEQKIVGVADIISALMGKRSYKESFDKTTILSIINDMADQGFIDAEIVKTAEINYEEMAESILKETKPVIEKYKQLQDEYRGRIQKHRLETN